MPPNKSGDQVLQDCHDDAADALRVKSVSGGTPATETPVRQTDTRAIALDFTSSVAAKWRPQQFTIHASATVNDPLTVKFVSKTGATYKTLMFTFPAGWTDLVWSPDNDRVYDSGDELQLECVNTVLATIALDLLGVAVP